VTTAVLVSLGATAPAESLRAGVEQLQAAGHQVHLISRIPPEPAVAAVLDGQAEVGPKLGRPLRLAKIAIDPHRLPGAATILYGPATRALVRGADILIAADAAALPAVWLAARINRKALAVNGLPAALARLP
jgi:hypothetical protein